MIRHTEFGMEWELDEDPKKGQLGLLRENHYRALFASDQRDQSFNRNAVWLDIGANIGSFAVRAAPLVKEVIACEPEPEVFEQLKRNIEINGIQNVYPRKAAVLGRPMQWVTLSLSNSFSSTHRLGLIRGRKKITVAGINIDHIVEMHNVNKVEIDAEGSEAEILESMNLDPIDELVFEYHFAILKDYDWSCFYRILRMLEDEGLTIIKRPATKSKTWHTIVWAKRL